MKMCYMILLMLLLFSAINLGFCHPAAKRVSPRVVDMVGGQLRAVVISHTAGGQLRAVVISQTAGAQMRAVVISRPGLRSVEAFLGVQYATAERFRRPSTSTRRWQGIRVTRDFGPVCPQRIPDMD